jgi:N6-adenosine-specific RNA methylase IME4
MTVELLPSGHAFAGLNRNGYSVVYADPPYRFATWTPRGAGRSPDSHYRTLSLDDICRLPIGSLATDDAWLFCWIPSPHLVAGWHVRMFKAWGFEPSSLGFVWVKLKSDKQIEKATTFDDCFFFGLGLTTRQNVELCLLAKRGSPPPPLSRSIRQVHAEAPREHSRKPEFFRRQIERYAQGPYLELFATLDAVPNWTLWGDEVGKYPYREAAE